VKEDKRKIEELRGRSEAGRKEAREEKRKEKKEELTK